MSIDNLQPAESSQSDEPQLESETTTTDSSESTDSTSKDEIMVPIDMARLWLEDSTPNTNDPVVNGDIIAVRRWGSRKANYNYLITSSIRKPPLTEKENSEAPNDLLESGTWYWPKRVSKEAKNTWSNLENRASMLGQNLDIKDRLSRYNVFLVRTDSDKVNPLYGITERNWEEVGKARDLIRVYAKGRSTGSGKTAGSRVNMSRAAKSSKSATSTLQEATLDNAVVDSTSSPLSEERMLEVVLLRAKDPSCWSICETGNCGFYGHEDWNKARACSLQTVSEVLEAAFNYHEGPSNLTAKQGEDLRSIRLRFIALIDPLSPSPRSSEVHIQRQGPEIFPALMFENAFYDLGSRSAENLLAIDQTEREGIVRSIIREAPHTLHSNNWILLLVLALGSEESIKRELDACDIPVENGWYHRTYQRIFLKLKGEFPELEASELHATWEGLKRMIRANDSEPGGG